MSRILVIDDDGTGAESLAALLRHRGHEAMWTPSGEAALARLRVEQYDALVVDEYLPGIDGMSVIRQMRERQAWRDVPALLLTAAQDVPFAAMREELEGLQPAAALQKPAEPAQILLLLGALLDGK